MKNLNKTFIIILLNLMLLPLGLAAQSGTAVVVYGEGEGFTVVRGGVSSYYDVLYDDVLGMLLYPGDTILTEEDTFLELQVTSNSSLIKIAENTSFIFEKIGNFGGGSLNVVYGRIRAKINKLTNDDVFEITGSGTVAGVRGTDFGYDLTYSDEPQEDEQSEIITTVYCFEGSVQVVQEDPVTEEVKEVLISAEQMVVTSTKETEAPLMVYDLQEEIDIYWQDNRFVFELPEQQVLVSLENKDDREDYSDKIFGRKRRLENVGGTLTVAGVLLSGSGFAAYSLMDKKGLGIGLLTAGGASFLTGLILMGQSSVLPDPPEGWPAAPVEPVVPEVQPVP